MTQPEGATCAEDHGCDPCDPTRPTALVAGCGGAGAVGADLLGIRVIAWLGHLSRQAGRPELAQLTLNAFVGPVLACVSATTVGAVLASRRPRHPVGWLLLALWAVADLGRRAPAYAAYALLARRGASQPCTRLPATGRSSSSPPRPRSALLCRHTGHDGQLLSSAATARGSSSGMGLSVAWPILLPPMRPGSCTSTRRVA